MLTIDIRQLRYAVATADARSFSRAAAMLNVKQSTLSKRIALLEDRLGITLFERSTRGALPTATGKSFLAVARRIVTDIDNLHTTARNVSYGEEGRLTVGFSSSLMAGNLRSLLSGYLVRYPDVQFDGIEAGPERLLTGLQSRMIDAAILPSGPVEPGIVSLPLWSERVLVVLPNSHALCEADRIYWTDLRREVFVIPRDGTGTATANLLYARLTDQGYRPNVIVQDTSLESIVSMVSVGRFITIVSEAMLGAAWPDLSFRDVHDPGGQAHFDFALFWREDNDNPALQRFFRLVGERYPAFECKGAM